MEDLDFTEEKKQSLKEEVAEVIIIDMETWGEEKFNQIMHECLPCCLRTNGDMKCFNCPNYPKEKSSVDDEEDTNMHLWIAEVCLFTSMAFEGLAENVGENN